MPEPVEILQQPRVVRNDGSVPFVAPQAGIDPVGTQDLVTKAWGLANLGGSFSSATLDAIDALLADGHPYIFCTDGSGIVQAIDFASAATGDMLVYDSSASPPWVSMAPRSIVVPLSGAVTLSNIPAAHTFWGAEFIRRIDLTGYRQVRLFAAQAAASSAGSQLRLRYATSFTTTLGSYSAIGTSEVAVTLTTSGSVTGLASSWIDLAAGAQTDVFLGLTTFDGNNTADPQFHAITAEFR